MDSVFVDVKLKKSYLMPELCVACGARWDAPHYAHPITHKINSQERLGLAFPACSACAAVLQKALKIQRSGQGRLSQPEEKRFQQFMWSFSIETIKPKTLLRRTPVIVFSFKQRAFAEQFAKLNGGKMR